VQNHVQVFIPVLCVEKVLFWGWVWFF